MVVAQLVERLLLTPEMRSFNTDIGKFYLTTISCIKSVHKDKEKDARKWAIFKEDKRPRDRRSRDDTRKMIKKKERHWMFESTLAHLDKGSQLQLSVFTNA